MKLLMIELTNKCNMDCWFCPHSKMKREQGFMSFETAKTAVEKMRMLGYKNVVLTNIGESLLHPHFFEMIEMFKEFETAATVNACALTEDLVEGLIHSSLDFLRISVDFDCNEKLVRRLLKEHINAEVNFKGVDRKTVVRLTEKWPEAQIMYLTNWADQMDFNNEVHSEICPLKDQDAGILLWDGRITPCCFDYEGDMTMGTIDDLENLHREDDYDICKNCGGMF